MVTAYYKSDRLKALMDYLYINHDRYYVNVKRQILRDNNVLNKCKEAAATKAYYKGSYYYFYDKNLANHKRIELDPSLKLRMDKYLENVTEFIKEKHVLNAYFTQALNLIDEVTHLYELFPNNLTNDMPRYWFAENIVAAANSIIEKNKSQIPKKIFSNKEEGDKVKIIQAKTDNEEGYLVVSQILTAHLTNN